jgi:hypothetical protein
MALRTFDPKQVLVIIGGVPMSGYADGTFVSVERTSDTFTKVSGADGIVSRAKSNDRSGSLTLTLAQTSPSNDVLSALAVTDELTNLGVVPVLIKEVSGSTVIVSAFGWVKKPPMVEYGKEIVNREWVLDLADVDFGVGGNPDSVSNPI